MPKLTIPSENEKKWEVSYVGDYYGHIINNYNIDLFSDQGKIKVGNKIYPHTTNLDDSDIDIPASFAFTPLAVLNNRFFIRDKKVFSSSNPLTTKFSLDTISNSPTIDGVAPDIIQYYTSSPQGYYEIHFVTAGPINFTEQGLKSGYIYVLQRNLNNWSWVSTSGVAGSPFLVHSVPTIIKKFGNSVIYIGNNIYFWSISPTIDDSRVITLNAELKLKFDYNEVVDWIQTTDSRVYIGTMPSGNKNNSLSAVYEYDPFSETIRKYEIQGGRTVGWIYDNILYVLDKTGQIRYFTGSSFVTYDYFPTYFRGIKIPNLPHRNGIKVVDNNVYFLWDGVNDGTYDFPAGIWCYEMIQKRLYHMKSLVFDKTYLNSFGFCGSNSASMGLGGLFYYDGNFYAGASVKDGSLNTFKGLFSSGKLSNVTVSGSNRGWIITPKFISSEINNIWRNILVKYKLSSGDKIVLKYRTAQIGDDDLTEHQGTWTSSTTFTSSFAPSIGDEINVKVGMGAGLIAHVTNVSGSGPYTITIDEGLSAISSGSFYYTVQKWQKIQSPITSTSKLSELLDIPTNESEWIQLKVELRDTAKIEELQIGYQPNLTIEK